MKHLDEATGGAPALTDLEVSRALQKFSAMRGRSVRLAFVACGPRVEASAPPAFREAAERWAVESALLQDPS